MSYTIPFYAYTTSRFGEVRSNGTTHRGHDVAPGGQDFPAWVDGVVVTAGYQSCLGNRVVIKNSADGYFIGVSHLANIKVGVGQQVRRATSFSAGTPLGNIGATGSCQNGRHAHITVSSSSAYPESGPVQDPVAYANNAGGGSGPAGTNYAYGLSNAAQTSLQRAMSHVGRYDGPHDGMFGPICVRAMQQWLKDLGYLPGDYTVDGVPGPTYGAGLQELARDKGHYDGPIDGDPGSKTSEALIYWAEEVVIKAGGGTSSAYAYGLTMAAQRAIQGALTRLKLYDGPVDGVFGPKSVAAMQTYLKQNALLPADYGIDGNPGPLYGAALQRLATRHGYDGAIDGIPGDMTSAALERWAATITGTVTPPPPVVTKWPTTGAFFPDVASPQRDVDMGKVKAGGAVGVIVKMGGLNVLPQYKAPYYDLQVDRGRAAGLKIGHYYLIGLGQTPEEQAAYFVSNLHDFRVDEDVLAIDNEKLDGNGTKWGDAAAARFIREVIRLTGIDKQRVWHYAGGADYRALAPWPEVDATGARFWWAAYGTNTGARQEEPDLRGSIPRWDVHQFSSMVDLAGYKLDGNWSPHTASVLWAKGTVVDPEPPDGPTPEERLAALVAAIGPDAAAINAAIDRITEAIGSA